jgi:hypothetical protein
MFKTLKKLFQSTPEPPPLAPVVDYPEWCAANPEEAEQLALIFPRAQLRRCDVHDVNLVTTMGYRSPMDCLPSGDFMDAASENPLCLDVGERRRWYARGIPQRLIYCPACEKGMRAGHVSAF